MNAQDLRKDNVYTTNDSAQNAYPNQCMQPNQAMYPNQGMYPNQAMYPNQGMYPNQIMVSPKSKGLVAILCFFLGFLGFHRFYVDKVGTGFIWLFTCGCFGIGALVDFIMILCGSFTDNNGYYIK